MYRSASDQGRTAISFLTAFTPSVFQARLSSTLRSVAFCAWLLLASATFFQLGSNARSRVVDKDLLKSLALPITHKYFNLYPAA